MKSPRNEQPGRIIRACLLAGLAILVLLTAYQKQHWDTDILWALKSGELITGSFHVPHTDPFSYTFGGRPWIDFTWGFQVLVHLFYSYLGGWTGLFILQSAIVALTFGFLYVCLDLRSRRPWIALLLVTLVFVGAHTRFFIRPHLFEFFFVTLSILLFTLYEKKGRPLYIYLLLPVQVLWVNIHSSAILGIFIAFAFFGGGVIDVVRRVGDVYGRGAYKSLKWYFFAAVALPVVSLLNPYGLSLVLFPFKHNSPDNYDAIRHIGEWIAPSLKETFFYIYPFPLDHFAVFLLMAFTAVVVLMNLRRIRTRDFFLLAAGLYLGLTHFRWMALLLFFAAPVLAENAGSYLDAKTREPGLIALFGNLLSAALVVLMLFDFVFGASHAADRGLGLKHGSYPSGTVDFMKSEKILGHVFNEYVFGGYLIFEYPELKVFIDGRTPTVYSPYFFWKSRLVNDSKRWESLAGEYGIDIALIKLKDSFCGKLREDKDWTAVSFDDTSVLYLKKTPAFKDVISNWSLESVDVCAKELTDLPTDEATLKKAQAALKKVAMDPATGSYARVHALLGLVDIKLGEREEAVRELQNSVEIAPDPKTSYTLGVTLGKLGKKKEALDAFKAAIDGNDKYQDAWLAAGVAYYDMKDYKNAVCYLRKYIDIADDMSVQIAFKTLGQAYFDSGDYERATVYLKRAAFLTDDRAELADIYYSLGNSLFESGSLAEGAHYYALALDNKPDYAAVLTRLADIVKGPDAEKKAGLIRGVLSSAARPVEKGPVKKTRRSR